MPTPGTLLSGLRLAVGVSGYVAPNLAGKAFGLDPAANPQAAFLGRLFAVRDIALVGAVQGTQGEARQLGWQLGIACDAADFVAAVLGARNGTLSKTTGILAGSTALAAVGLGVAAWQAGE